MRELGSGGFGRTYEVSDQGTLKVLKVLINNSPKAVELFQREAEVLSQLASPSIPKVEPNSYFIFHPSNSQEPLHCLVMEKVEGMNLREYLKQRGRPVDSDSAQRWLVELLAVLQQVHDAGILHRDIKPQNIIFKPDGKLALIDFGAVREGTGTEVATAARSGGTEVATQAGGTSIVSAGYTAPEQVNGQALKQSDLYSLGRTFIFLLTGKEPSSLAYDAYNDTLKWREYAPGIDLKLAELLDQMTATSVRQRPATTQEMLQQLTSKPASASSAKFKTQIKSTDSDNPFAEYVGSYLSTTSPKQEPNSATVHQTTRDARLPNRNKFWLLGGLICLVGLTTAIVPPMLKQQEIHSLAIQYNYICRCDSGICANSSSITAPFLMLMGKEYSEIDRRYAEIMYDYTCQPPNEVSLMWDKNLRTKGGITANNPRFPKDECDYGSGHRSYIEFTPENLQRAKNEFCKDAFPTEISVDGRNMDMIQVATFSEEQAAEKFGEFISHYFPSQDGQSHWYWD